MNLSNVGVNHEEGSSLRVPRVECSRLPARKRDCRVDSQTESDPFSLVDPMIGSANAGYTFSGAVFPFGVVSFSPEELASSATKRNTPGFSL
jgi:hypothetical protein